MLIVLGTFGFGAYAQNVEMLYTGKKGVISFSRPVRVGGTLLQPGDYQIQHVMDGQGHVVVFRELETLQPEYPYPFPGKEVARATCRVEPLEKKVGNSGVRLGVNAAGEKFVEEVYIHGERLGHLL
jgi:hypothetical protein